MRLHGKQKWAWISDGLRTIRDEIIEFPLFLRFTDEAGEGAHFLSAGIQEKRFFILIELLIQERIGIGERDGKVR